MRDCASCPQRQADYCGCFDTLLAHGPDGYVPEYQCGSETETD